MTILIKYIKVSMLMLLFTVISNASFTVNDDYATTVEDTTRDIDVLANDTKIEGTTLTIIHSSLSMPDHGTVTLNSNGTVQYTPQPCYHGIETFTYSATDGTSIQTATVTITVSNIYNDTYASNDTAITNENTPVDIPVLANDSTMGGCGSLSVLYGSVTTPVHGTTRINADGTINYTPNENYNGADTFNYTLTDGDETDIATVTVTVTGINDAPVAVDDTKTTMEDTPVDIPVLINDSDIDGDTLYVLVGSIVTPAHGTAVINLDGTIKYTPNLNFYGIDSFEYTVTDGNLTDTGIVTIDVAGTIETMIMLSDDTIKTREDTAVDIAVLANDIDESTLAVVSTSIPANGIVKINGDNTVTYTPNLNFYGIDTFSYTASDGVSFDTAIVRVTVTPVNDAPVAVDDGKSTHENISVDIPVLINDSDIDSDTLSVLTVVQPIHGSVVINADDTLTYAPNLNYDGSDTFLYTVTDGNLTDVGVVTIVVEPIVIPIERHVCTLENTAVNIIVLVNDGLDGDVYTLESVTTPTHGTIGMNTDGTIKYTPNTGFIGIDTFIYHISDGTGSTNLGKVFVNVISLDKQVNTTKNTPINITIIPEECSAYIYAPTNLSTPTHGSVTLNEDKTIKYTPNKNFEGVDTFTYLLRTAEGSITSHTATVMVSGMPPLPDYEISLSTSKGVFFNDDSNFTIMITVTEIANGINSEDVVLSITKNNKMSLTLIPSISIMDGKTLSNRDWEFTETNSSYRLKYIGNDTMYPSITRMYIGLVGVFNAPNNVRGKFPLTVRLRNDSGDSNTQNNADIEVFSYSNIK